MDTGVNSPQTKDIRFWGLVWPIWLEMFLLLFMGNSDAWMLSFVSDEAVAAVGWANQYIVLALLVMRVVTVGTQVMLAQYLGAEQWQRAAKIAADSLALNAAAGIVLSVLLIVFRKPLLLLLHTDAAVMGEAESYLAIVGGGLFAQSAVNGLSGILRTYGYAREALYASVAMNVLNVAGNAVLIFGWRFIPAMGVTGAAIATMGSRIVVALLMAGLLVRLTPVRLTPSTLFSMSPSDARSMAAIGAPAAAETFTYHAVQTLFLSWIGLMGTEAVASRQYVMNITMFISLFSGALSTANSIVVGRLAGAREAERACLQTFRSVRWSFLLVLGASVIVILHRERLIGIFSQDPLVLEWGSLLLVLNVMLETGKAISMNVVGSLRSVGDAKITAWMGLISMVGISLPVAYFLGVTFGLGLAGIWIATAIDEWVRGLVLMKRWKRRRWEALHLL